MRQPQKGNRKKMLYFCQENLLQKRKEKKTGMARKRNLPNLLQRKKKEELGLHISLLYRPNFLNMHFHNFCYRRKVPYNCLNYRPQRSNFRDSEKSDMSI